MRSATRSQFYLFGATSGITLDIFLHVIACTESDIAFACEDGYPEVIVLVEPLPLFCYSVHELIIEGIASLLAVDGHNVDMTFILRK
jgi:hypothetical protein